MNVIPEESNNDIENLKSKSVKADVHNEGDVLILGAYDNDSEVDEEEEVDSASQKSTIQEVLSFAFNFCVYKFDFVKDQILYGLTQAKDKVKKLKILLTPQLETTFLHNPKDSESNSSEKWDTKKLSFNKSNNWVPKSHSKKTT